MNNNVSQAARKTAITAPISPAERIYGASYIPSAKHSMSRSALVENITAMLTDAGFLVSDRCAIRPKSFDVAARRGEDVLLVKILANIDAFDANTGAEMRRLGITTSTRRPWSSACGRATRT